MFKNLKIAFAALFAASVIPGFALANDSVSSEKVDNATVEASISKTGTFKGKSKHVTTGGITIIKTGQGYIAVLENNFSLDGAPAPTLGFGNKGKFDPATEFTALKTNTGAQVYSIPASIDPTQFSEFYVWCADFSVPLGVAALK